MIAFKILICLLALIYNVIGSQSELESTSLLSDIKLHEDSMSAWELEQEQRILIFERRSVLRQQIHLMDVSEECDISHKPPEKTIIKHITSKVIFDVIQTYLTLKDFVGLYTVNTQMYNFLRHHYLVEGHPIMNRLRFYPPVLGSGILSSLTCLETHVVKTTDNHRWDSLTGPMTILYNCYSPPFQNIILWKTASIFDQVSLLWCKIQYEVEKYHLHLSVFPQEPIDPTLQSLYQPMLIPNVIIPVGFIDKETENVYRFAWFDLPLYDSTDGVNLELILDGDLMIKAVYQQIDSSPEDYVVINLIFTYDYHCKNYTSEAYWSDSNALNDYYEPISRIFTLPQVKDKRGSIYIKHSDQKIIQKANNINIL